MLCEGLCKVGPENAYERPQMATHWSSLWISSGLRNRWRGILGIYCHWWWDLAPLQDTRNETTILSVEPSRAGETAEVQTNTVCRQNDSERHLGQEGVTVVRIHACRYNNQCGPLLWHLKVLQRESLLFRNVVFNANNPTFNCEKSLRILFYGQPS